MNNIKVGDVVWINNPQDKDTVVATRVDSKLKDDIFFVSLINYKGNIVNDVPINIIKRALLNNVFKTTYVYQISYDKMYSTYKECLKSIEDKEVYTVSKYGRGDSGIKRLIETYKVDHFPEEEFEKYSKEPSIIINIKNENIDILKSNMEKPSRWNNTSCDEDGNPIVVTEYVGKAGYISLIDGEIYACNIKPFAGFSIIMYKDMIHIYRTTPDGQLKYKINKDFKCGDLYMSDIYQFLKFLGFIKTGKGDRDMLYGKIYDKVWSFVG